MTTLLFSVDKPRLSVAPGASVELAVTVRNLTTLLDQVAVRVEGIDPSWVQVVPQHLPVFAQGQASARVIIQPPRDPRLALAGDYPLRVTGSTQENPGQEGEASATLEIQLVGDYRLLLEGGGASAPQEATYTLRVQNDANAPLSARLGGSDTHEALWFKFDPFQVTANAGDQAVAALAVRARHADAGQSVVEMNVAAQGEYLLRGGAQTNAPARQVSGQFAPAAPPTLVVSIQPSQLTDLAQARYELRVGNTGATATEVRLEGMADDSALELQFQPTQLALPPQSEVKATLSVRAKAPLAPGEQKVLAFRVRAAPLAGHAGRPAEASAQFVQAAPALAAPPQGRALWPIVVIVLLALLIVVLILVSSLNKL